MRPQRLQKMRSSMGREAFTHLHNAMPPMMNRAPGIVAAALNSDAYTGLIGDGYHVDDEMIKLTLNARPKADPRIYRFRRDADFGWTT